MNGAGTNLWMFHRRQAKSLLQLNRRSVVVQQHAVGTNRNGSLSSHQSRSFFSYSRRAVTLTLTRPMTLALAATTNKYVPPFARNLNGIRWFHHTAVSAAEVAEVEEAEAATLAEYETPVKIFFASQTGTAQLFSQDLAQALQEHGFKTVSMQPLDELDTSELSLSQGQSPLASIPTPVFVILASTTGAGEPPDHARHFYDWLQEQPPLTAATNAHAAGIRFAVFGLGNSKAHPNHYNTVAKTLDSRLQALGHEAVLPLHLGDDGDCIDDDFDQWLSQLHIALSSPGERFSNSHHESETKTDTTTSSTPTVESAALYVPSSSNNKYPVLHLQEPSSADTRIGSTTRGPFLDTCPTFYMPGSRLFSVSDNRLLSHDPTSNGLCELQVQLPDDNNADNKTMKYETGDHFVLYPRNADCLVQAFLHFFGVSPDAVITGYDSHDQNNKGDGSPSALPYTHPIGITVDETLSHCVDLESSPSPSLARRLLTGQHQQQRDGPNLDYKREIAHPRRTVLELLLQSQQQQDKTKMPNISLSDLLWLLPPLQPRYYSIASSAAVHPDAVSLTYRPVQYVTSRGILRHGVCTSYMRQLSAVKSTTDDDPSQQPSSVTAVIRSNPSFRLPADPATPIWMIAGGCGVAPIRAFLEERLHRAPMLENKYGPAWLFLGFRSPADQVYTDLVQQALAAGAITKSCLTFQEGCATATVQAAATGNGDATNSTEQASAVGCGLVSDQVRRYGAAFWAHCQAGGMIYLCGGARTFGVAIENEVHAIFQEHGGLSEQEATAYLQQLIHEGRLCEDLAD
jgi:NADPH-ferrihemoprotein reductase